VRGQPLHWAGQVPERTGDVAVQMLPIDPPQHLMKYKPDFMLSIAARAPAAKAFIYIDPDIVIKSSWSEIDDWCVRGIAAVGDENWLMPASSPIRARWREL